MTTKYSSDPTLRPLSRGFYQRHPAEVAPDLLGKILVRRLGDVTLCGRIVETEAYCSTDPASHSFRGRTERNKAMFGEVGHAYIYFIHGLHYCVNVTARLHQPAGGVLIRALEPLAGIDAMRELRGKEALKDLASGPAKLTQALNIDKVLYGTDMTSQGELFIASESATQRNDGIIAATPRIGISQGTDVLWRFVIEGHSCLSK